MTTYNLDFDKDVMPGTFDSAGDTVTYMFTLSPANSDGSPWTDLVISDAQLGITNVPIASIAGLSGDSDNDGVLDNGETWTWDYTYTLSQADFDAGTSFITNTASVTGKTADGELSVHPGTA